MPTPDVDVAAMVDVLLKHKVKFLIIGGFAIELHDVPVPPTRDVDVTPDMEAKNLTRLAAALNELGARLRVPGGSPEGVEIPGGVKASRMANMVSIAFVTSAGPLDVSLRPDGTSGYEDLAQNVEIIRFQDRALPVAALQDVIRSKEAAGREKDLIVLPALREHLRRRSS
ncbi:MAG: hypothetical protein ACRDVD_01175 [Acidimicrobiia bacterium]